MCRPYTQLEMIRELLEKLVQNTSPVVVTSKPVVGVVGGLLKKFYPSGGEPRVGNIIVSRNTGRVHIVNEVREVDNFIRIGYDAWFDPSNFIFYSPILMPSPEFLAGHGLPNAQR